MGLQLRFRLSSGEYAIPLSRIDSVAGFARLVGEPDGYFLGWLRRGSEQVPVFDLNRAMCGQPTPESFGSRIILVETRPGTPVRRLGLFAAGVTDTVLDGNQDVKVFELDTYLPLLCQLIPPVPSSGSQPAGSTAVRS